MALKFTVDDIVEVPGPLRSEYKKGEDGKFHLVLDGTHPHTTKLSEMRETNVALLKERADLATKLAAFEGLDPIAAKAALAKATAGDPEDVVALRLELATEKSKTAAAQSERDNLVLRQTVGSEFIALGGRPDATEFITSRVPFVVVDGELQPKEGEISPNVKEWLITQLETSAFAFFPNTGGGAKGARAPSLGARSNVRELINPTPQELGAAAADIKAGKAKVSFTT